MLAYGRCRFAECKCRLHEWRCRNWNGGFLPWLPGRIDDDRDVKSHTICVVEVQGKPQGHMFTGSHAHIVHLGCSHYGQHPANVDSHHWFLETLLWYQRSNGFQQRDEPKRFLLLAMGESRTTPLQFPRRKRILGCELLRRKTIVHIPNRCVGLAHTDFLHLGRFCLHVHRNHAGHTTPCQAQETVEADPLRSTSITSSVSPHHCSRSSHALRRLLGLFMSTCA